MFDEVNAAIEEYRRKWGEFIAPRKNKEFFDRLKLTAVGWKVADLAEYDRLFSLWREQCDHVHVARLNDRWIAAMHLKDTALSGDMQIIKLMQRRPGSDDAVGLDHLDFFDAEETNTLAILKEESDMEWSEEENGLCKWISVWFAGTEAKLRQETVFDVSMAELRIVNNKILGPKYARPHGESQRIDAEVE